MIQTNNYHFIDIKSLKDYILENISDSDKLLIQIFSHVPDEKFIDSLREAIHSELPKAHIIGTSTDGSIHNIHENPDVTTISFSTFQKSSLKHQLIPFELGNEEVCAQKICENLLTDKTRVLILFAEGILCNAEKILKFIHIRFPQIIIAGGSAGDASKLLKTYVCDSKIVASMAIVGVAIESESLIVHNDFNLSW
jgi:hypothetical protein